MRTLPHRTTCWWCGSYLTSRLYGVRFFSKAYQRYRVRDICARCWYKSTGRKTPDRVPV